MAAKSRPTSLKIRGMGKGGGHGVRGRRRGVTGGKRKSIMLASPPNGGNKKSDIRRLGSKGEGLRGGERLELETCAIKRKGQGGTRQKKSVLAEDENRAGQGEKASTKKDRKTEGVRLEKQGEVRGVKKASWDGKNEAM